MKFSFNDNLDLTAAKSRFGEDRRIRLGDFLAPDQAGALARCLAEDIPYEQAYFVNDANQQISFDAFRELGAAERQKLISTVYSQAAEGVGFWYGRHGVSDDTHEILRDFLEWLKSEPVLQAIRDLTGATDVRRASAQATRFLPGDFLTRHTDTVGREGRRVAYVMNLSSAWHPDCGGLLQFYHPDGRPRDAWTPLYNSMCLFDVAHVHAVTCVAPFAPRPRLAVSGWFKVN